MCIYIYIYIYISIYWVYAPQHWLPPRWLVASQASCVAGQLAGCLCLPPACLPAFLPTCLPACLSQ